MGTRGGDGGAVGEEESGARDVDAGRISDVEEERSRHGSGRGAVGRRRGSMAPPRPQGALSLQVRAISKHYSSAIQHQLPFLRNAACRQLPELGVAEH